MKILLFVFLSTLCGTQLLRAQDTATTLSQLAKVYDESKTELMKPVTDLQTMYAGKLEELKAEATQNGQLNRVLAIKSEADAFRSGETPTIGDDFPKLKNLQSIYRQALPARLQQANTALAPLTASYAAKLKEMMADLTKQEKLTDALQVKAVLDALTEAQKADAPAEKLEALSAVTQMRPDQTFRVRVIGFFQPGGSGTKEDFPDWASDARQRFKQFIPRARYGGGWIAITDRGEVMVTKVNPPPKRLRNIVKVQAELLTGALNADGELTIWGFNEKNHSVLPEKLDEVRDFIMGDQIAAIQYLDGSIVLWNDKLTPKDHPQIPKEKTAQVVQMSAGKGRIYLRNEDGTAFWFDSQGNTGNAFNGAIVTTIAAADNGCFALSTDGKLLTDGDFLTAIDSYGKDRDPNGPYQSLSLIGAIMTLQKTDGTWILHGPEDTKPILAGVPKTALQIVAGGHAGNVCVGIFEE